MQLHDGRELFARVAKFPKRFNALHRTPVGLASETRWCRIGLKKCGVIVGIEKQS